MRLVCPNCDAEYEVDASVIPDTGRDVQCSNCGHTWFQMSPTVEAELEAEEALYEAPPAPAVPPAAEPSPEPLLRSIDDSVLAVLREEAEREAEARKTEAPPVIETQTEMGLAPAQSPRRVVTVGSEKLPARRDLLPEIEELNSTLRSSSEKRSGETLAMAEAVSEEAPKRSGFRSGFTLMILIAIALTVIYMMAPKLTEQFPAISGILNAYVAWVDQLRVSLDRMVKNAISFLNGLIGKQA
jgi:predicted Zn finger-like uncharacterized protein